MKKKLKLIPITKQEETLNNMVSLFILPSYDEAASVLTHLLSLAIIRTPTLNDLLNRIRVDPIDKGDDYGWPDIYQVMMSCNYGIVKHNCFHEIKYYSLHLPKISKLSSVNKEKI